MLGYGWQVVWKLWLYRHIAKAGNIGAMVLKNNWLSNLVTLTILRHLQICRI
jgi:hypothetical protein